MLETEHSASPDRAKTTHLLHDGVLLLGRGLLGDTSGLRSSRLGRRLPLDSRCRVDGGKLARRGVAGG